MCEIVKSVKRNKPFLDRGIPLENTKQKEEKRNGAASKQKERNNNKECPR